MHTQESNHFSIGDIRVTDEKPTDIQIPAGDYTIFVSIHQARYLSTVHMGMIPYFIDEIDQEPPCPHEL